MNTLMNMHVMTEEEYRAKSVELHERMNDTRRSESLEKERLDAMKNKIRLEIQQRKAQYMAYLQNVLNKQIARISKEEQEMLSRYRNQRAELNTELCILGRNFRNCQNEEKKGGEE